MSTDRYDMIIDRYINGEMAPAEEADFRKLLELDPDLRRLFEADQRIAATLRKEREILVGVDHAESYSRFLMSLAASVPATSASTTTIAASAGKRWRRWLFGGLGLLLVGALIIAVMRHDPAPAGGRAGDSVRAAPSVMERPGTPELRPSLPGTPTPAQRGAPSLSSDTGRAHDVIGERPQSMAPSQSGSRDSAGRSGKAAPAARPSQERKREEIPTFEDDTIRARLKMEHSDR